MNSNTVKKKLAELVACLFCFFKFLLFTKKKKLGIPSRVFRVKSLPGQADPADVKREDESSS